MCKLRTNIVSSCRKCKASYRRHCPERKKTRTKTYKDTKKKGEFRTEVN